MISVAARCIVSNELIRRSKFAEGEEKARVKSRLRLKIADELRELSMTESEDSSMDLVYIECRGIFLDGEEAEALKSFMKEMVVATEHKTAVHPVSPQEVLFNRLGGNSWREKVVEAENAFA